MPSLVASEMCIRESVGNVDAVLDVDLDFFVQASLRFNSSKSGDAV